MLKKVGILIVVVGCVGGYVAAAEQPVGCMVPGMIDESCTGLYPTQIFEDCREGEYENALIASKEQLFQRNSTGDLPLHFALIEGPQENKTRFQMRQKLVERYIKLANDPYEFVCKDLWHHIGTDAEIIKMSFGVAQRSQESRYFIQNAISDPVWNLLVSKNSDRYNRIYRAVRDGNSKILHELLQVAHSYGKAESLASKAFHKASSNQCCSVQMMKELNQYMKLNRDDMGQAMLKHTHYHKELLEDILNKIFEDQ